LGTSIDYSTVSHETIYKHITGGPGSAEMMDASRGWRIVAAKMQEFQGSVERAVQGVGAAQQGAAADAATHATMALTPWVAGAATTANGIAARVCEQAAVFAHTRDNMPPPRVVPEVSFSQDPGTWIADHAVEWLPGIQTEHERAQAAAQQDEQRARELMSGYQGASNENLAVRQHFTAAPTVVAEVADPAPGGVGVGGANSGWSTHPSSVHAGVTHPASAHSALAHPAWAHSGPVAGGHGASAPPAATAPQLASGVHQAPAAVSPQLVGGYPSSGAAPAAGSGSFRPDVAAPFGPSPMRSGAAGGDRIRGGSRFSGGGGGVSRGGGFGPRPSPTFGAGDSRLDSSPGQGSALHGSAEPTGAGRAARGGAGWADVPLGATGGSGRGAGGSEHRRPSYLIEQDTSAIVGELPRVAPPVIGADEDYR
jgi:PPE family